MRSIPPLNWLRAFESTARHRSFSQAGKELNVTTSAISQRVKSLEDYLQITLLVRDSKPLQLTETGHQYLPMVSQAFLQLETATENIFGQTDNVVRLCCGVAFSSLFIVPRLPEFRQAYPEIEIQFHNNVWWEQRNNSKNRLEIRYGDGNWQESSLLLTDDAVAPMVGKNYPALNNNRNTLTQQPLFEVSGLRHNWHEWLKLANQPSTETKPIVYSDSIIPIYLMAIQNQGIALLSLCYTDYARKTGELIQLFNTVLPTQESFYLLQPEKLSKAEQCFTDWLVAQCR